MEKKQYVYLFNEGNASMKNLLGGKGANLSEMTILGIPVPQGFTVKLKHVISIMKMTKRFLKILLKRLKIKCLS